MTNICCKLISLCLNRHIRLTLYSCQNKIFLNNIYVLFCLFLLNCFISSPLQLLYVLFYSFFFSAYYLLNYIKVTNTTPIFINCIVVSFLLLHLHLQSDLSFWFFINSYTCIPIIIFIP